MPKYESYESYVAHQAQKLRQHSEWVASIDAALKEVLASRLQQYAELLAGKSVLCLGARLGGEVQVFRKLGCFAVGIDLNPGVDNPYVLQGDFHAIAFPTTCVEVVFTNSLDHALSLELVLSQVRRILVPEGLLITEIVRGTEEGYRFDEWDVCKWKRAEDVVEVIARAGFTEVRRQKFERPWPGVHLLWTKNRDPLS